MVGSFVRRGGQRQSAHISGRAGKRPDWRAFTRSFLQLDPTNKPKNSLPGEAMVMNGGVKRLGDFFVIII